MVKPHLENAGLVDRSRPAGGLCRPLLAAGGTGHSWPGPAPGAAGASGQGPREDYLRPDSGQSHPGPEGPMSVVSKAMGGQVAGCQALLSVLFLGEV